MRLASFRSLAVASLLVTAAACGDVTPEEEVASALELDNGGLDTADEAPLFGEEDTFAAASLEADATATDSMTGDAEVMALRARPDVAKQRVMLLWGQLPPDRDAAAHVWDGRLQLSRGAILVRREIGFEDATDQVAPRQVRAVVGFASTTQPFADGLVLEVLDPDPANAAPLTLTYTPRGGAAPLVFDLGALGAGPISYDVGAGGDRMVAASVEADDACDHGFMRGRWHAVRANLGRFLGVVSDADGAPIGHLRGVWGARRNGEQVMFAKYIDRDGGFRGIFAGTYEAGNFEGRWIIGTGDHGRAQGRYRESVPGPAIGGGFVGRWAETSCAASL
jgi:hypothetical protein